MPRILEKIGVTAQNYALTALVEKHLEQSPGEARIVGFKNNKIYIEVQSSAAMQELHFRKRDIQKTLQAVFPAREPQGLPEIKIFVKGMARLGAADRLRKTPEPAARTRIGIRTFEK